jgi:hypothetical protein
VVVRLLDSHVYARSSKILDGRLVVLFILSFTLVEYKSDLYFYR